VVAAESEEGTCVEGEVGAEEEAVVLLVVLAGLGGAPSGDGSVEGELADAGWDARGARRMLAHLRSKWLTCSRGKASHEVTHRRCSEPMARHQPHGRRRAQDGPDVCG